MSNRNRAFTRAVRARMARTGENYTTARRRLMQPQPCQTYISG